ncbi:pyridoxamine 5'-phosphate oxidase family protein [Embleya sp. NPDC020886]|uniref:pyridoxamine 5'-phosphate oxidase family protein n=1 Tax=Embleya sp. NPDC020886 TaxID=3363980 RepID=UPI0037955F57
MPHDTNRDARASQQLAPADALALMASVAIGRVVFSLAALPAIVPVHFRFDRGTLVFRLVGDERVRAALHDCVCAFEADAYDRRERSGWTVTVTGRAHCVPDTDEAGRPARVPPRGWDSGEPRHFFRITPEVVVGRLLHDTGRPLPV